METLWDSSPQTALEVTRALEPSTHWAENTVRTMLTRLVDKGALTTAANEAGTRTFHPVVSREACVKAESISFMQQVFRGASSPLLMHFAQQGNLTADEVEKLKQLLDESVKS